ncbi:MAG: hypothetical protein ACOCZW_04415 [Bacteroidota bacterium]
MVKAGSISGASIKVNRDSSRDTYSGPVGKGAKPQKAEMLPKGEIVYGRITEMRGRDSAYVRLPVGTLLAKVHSANTSISGAPVLIEELMRQLDLPDNDIYRSIVDVLRSRSSKINREDVLLIYRAFISLSESISKAFPAGKMISVLAELHLSGLKPDKSLLETLINIKFGFGDLKKSIDMLIKYNEALDQGIRESLQIFFKALRSSDQTSAALMLNTESSAKNESLFSIVDKILKSDISSSAIKEYAKTASVYIESLSAWNVLSFSTNAAFYFIYPLFLKNGYLLTLFKTRRNKKKNAGTDRLNELLDEEISEMAALLDDIKSGKEISLNDIIKNPDILQKVAEEFEKSFTGGGKALHSVKFTDGESFYKKIIPQSKPSARESISVVI